MAASAGTQEARSHEPKPIRRPMCSATLAPMGFADVAVSQSADETDRLAMPENMRKPPVRRRFGSSGLEPTPSASESTMG